MIIERFDTDEELERVLDQLSDATDGAPVPDDWKRRTMAAIEAEAERIPMAWPSTLLVSSVLGVLLALMHLPMLTATSAVGVLLLTLGYGSGLRLLLRRA